MADYATWCPTYIVPNIVKNYWYQLGRKGLFDNDPILNMIQWKRQKLLDKRDMALFNKYAEESNILMKKFSPEERTLFRDDIYNIANAIEKRVKDLEWSEYKTFQPMRLSQELKIKKYSDEIVNNVKYLEDLFIENEVQPYKFFQAMNKDTLLTDIYQNINGSHKYAFLMLDWVNIKNLKWNLESFAKTRWIPSKDIVRFIEDMMWEPLLAKQWEKWIGWFKSLYSFLKYSPLTWLVSGSLLLANNTLLGTTLLLSKKRWLEWLLKSEWIDYLLNTEKFLASESRAWETIMNRIDQDWKNFFNRVLDKTFWLIPQWPIWDRLRTFFQWWVHNIWDMAVESTVKRYAIAEALAKNWINSSNMETFMNALNKGLVSEEFLIKLRADASLNRNKFFTVWSSASLNRNRFSRRWLINTLQNYVINRSDDVWSWITKFYKDFKANPKRVRWEFSDYLMTENQELKSLLNNILLAAKLGIYIDAMTEWHEWEDREKRVFKYVTSMSDYLSSLRSTFFYRLLTSPVKWLDSYYDYTEATWQSEEFIEWVSVAFLKTISDTFWMMFREWKVLNILSDSVLAYLKTWDIDFAKDITEIDLKKITDGMWRYSLLDWYDSFWQKGIESKDDMVWRIVFEYPEFNEAANKSQRIRDIWTIENMLNDPKRFISNMLYNFPLISSFYKASSTNPTGQFAEAALKQFQYEVDNNPIMKQIWKWELPSEILNNEDTVNSLYNELLAHSYYWKKLGKKWEHVVSEYWLTSQEEKVFVDNIATWLWITTSDLENILKSNRDKSYLVKAMAAAEANMPGSSKIVLGYLANNMLYENKKAVFWKWFSNVDIDPGVENQLRKQVVEQLYPYLYYADKSSWYKVAREYMSSYKPEIFANLKSDSELTWFVNTLSFLDLIYWNEANQWDVDAWYIKNIFNVAGKYIKDDWLRTKLVTNSLNTISWLHNATQTQKQLMRMWVLAANINHYDKMKKDPIANIVYKNDLDKFERTIWWVNENLNMAWMDWMMGDLSDSERKQYYWSTNKSYKNNSNYGSNKKVMNELDKWFNKLFNPAVNWRPEISRETGIIVPQINLPAPKQYSLYYKIYNDTYKAVSEDITRQSGRKYPAETIEWLKFNKPGYWKTRKYTGPSTRIAKSGKKYPSKSVKKSLPWG